MRYLHLKLCLSGLLFTAALSNAETPSAANNTTADKIIAQAQWAERRVVASFTEYRKLPFRRSAHSFKGNIRIDPNHGFSIEYISPNNYIISPSNGQIYRRSTDSEWQIPDIPESYEEMILSLIKILEWNPSWMKENFITEASTQNDQWQLLLTPLPQSTLRQNIRSIEISGQADIIKDIHIDQGSQRTIRYVMESVDFPQEFSPEISRLYFSTP